MARAAAHGRTVPQFADPTALALLPDDARARVERFVAGDKSKGFRGRFRDVAFDRRAKMMVARTVAIDEAVRAVDCSQLVILGAGLDGRAWRMPELRNASVFEVDHPDSQRDKRERAAALTLVARELHFVPVDFTRDDLDAALAAAGHDPGRPTTWIWEGVVMYLAARDIESTLAVVQRRSAAKSRLVVSYASPSPLVPLVNWMVSRLGEPFRSVFTATEMRRLVERRGFKVVRDESAPTIGLRLSDDLARGTKRLRHMRVVTADYR